MRIVLVALALALLLEDAAIAHGGSWKGPPPGQTPGGGRPGRPKRPKTGPGDTNPPTSPPTSPPTDPGEPSETPEGPPPTEPPPEAPKGPTTGGTPVPPTVGVPGAPATGGPTAPPGGRAGITGGANGARRRAASGPESWERWWAQTRELYLGRHAATSLGIETGNGGFLTGRSGGEADDLPLLPETVRRELLPVLARALGDSAVDVADSAAIAIGRATPQHDAAALLPLLERNLAHDQRSPREAAVLALGILGGSDATRSLRKIALDQPEGRALCGSAGPIDEVLRGLAALALGLVGTQEAMTPLVTLATSDSTPRELAGCAVLGLGLQREAAPAAVVTLARLLEDRILDREVRAQVPIAIARLPTSAARGLLPKLVAVLGDRRTADELARSTVLALGRVATAEDLEILRSLMDAARRHGDAPTRGFALLALGRIFERGLPSGDAPRAELERAQAFLVEQLRGPAHGSDKPWAALALGLLGRGDPTCGTAAPSASLVQIARKMIESFEDESDPSLQGALAIGLGLLRSPAAAPVLRTRLSKASQPSLRGHLATSLGLLEDHAAIAPLRELLGDRSLAPAHRVDVARALALAGDTGFEGELLALLGAADDLPSAVAYAKALGLVGGRASADALRAMAEDRSLPEMQRGFAIVAIGLLAEKTVLPWNVPYLVDANFTLSLRPLDEVFDVL